MNGAYFITICTKDRFPYLSEIIDAPENVGAAALGRPWVRLTEIGGIVDKNILLINEKYEFASVPKYIIMPDHIHMILNISEPQNDEHGGRPRAASPTKNVSLIVNALKTISTKQIGFSIWQRSYYDHIIRGEGEFAEIWRYIENNPENHANNIFNQNLWR